MIPADPGTRIVAYLIDIAPFLVMPVVGIIPCLGVVLVFAALLASVPYFLCREMLFDGRSFGKKTMKLRVVDARTGQRPETSALILRNLVMFIPFFPLVELIMFVTDGQRRRLGDQWLNTIVVSSEN